MNYSYSTRFINSIANTLRIMIDLKKWVRVRNVNETPRLRLGSCEFFRMRKCASLTRDRLSVCQCVTRNLLVYHAFPIQPTQKPQSLKVFQPVELPASTWIF